MQNYAYRRRIFRMLGCRRRRLPNHVRSQIWLLNNSQHETSHILVQYTYIRINSLDIFYSYTSKACSLYTESNNIFFITIFRLVLLENRRRHIQLRASCKKTSPKSIDCRLRALNNNFIAKFCAFKLRCKFFHLSSYVEKHFFSRQLSLNSKRL